MILAVYGTLRQGDYNHRYINSNPLGVERIEGFEMYHNGSYPYITRGGGDITVEVYDLEPEIVFNIADMEREVGYIVTEVETSHGTALIFSMSQEAHERRRSSDYRGVKILSGDWFEWVNNHHPGRLVNEQIG